MTDAALVQAAHDTVLAAGGISTGSGLVSVVIGLVFAFACSAIASRKGRGQILWGILGFFFSLITLIVILILPRKN